VFAPEQGLPEDLKPLPGQLEPLPGNLDSLPGNLNADLLSNKQKIKKRSSPIIIKETIRELCLNRQLTAQEIAGSLNRNIKHIRDAYLYPMVASGELFLIFPENVNHPFQKYQSRNPAAKQEKQAAPFDTKDKIEYTDSN